MTQNELIKSISLHTGIKLETVAGVMRAYVGIASEEIRKGGSVRLRNLGTLRYVKTPPHNGYNPVKRKTELFKGRNKVKFTVSKILEQDINAADAEPRSAR